MYHQGRDSAIPSPEIVANGGERVGTELQLTGGEVDQLAVLRAPGKNAVTDMPCPLIC